MAKKYQPSGYIILHLTGEQDQEGRVILQHDSDYNILCNVLDNHLYYQKPLLIYLNDVGNIEYCGFGFVIDGEIILGNGTFHDDREEHDIIYYQ